MEGRSSNEDTAAIEASPSGHAAINHGHAPVSPSSSSLSPLTSHHHSHHHSPSSPSSSSSSQKARRTPGASLRSSSSAGSQPPLGLSLDLSTSSSKTPTHAGLSPSTPASTVAVNSHTPVGSPRVSPTTLAGIEGSTSPASNSKSPRKATAAAAAAGQQQGSKPGRQQPFPNPALNLTPGTLRSAQYLVDPARSPATAGPAGPGHGTGTSPRPVNHQHQHQYHQHHPHQYNTAPAGLLERTRAVLGALLGSSGDSATGTAGQLLGSNMVASPRLPFYSARDEDSHTSVPNGVSSSGFYTPDGAVSGQQQQQHVGLGLGAGNGPFTPHYPKHSTTPSISFTGPNGLFSPQPGSSATKGLLSPQLFQDEFDAVSSNGRPSSKSGHRPVSSITGKRTFYKDKDSSSLYPTSGKGGASTSPASAAPGKTSFFRVPRSIARLASRRSRVLPTIIVCSALFFWALGSTRRSSLYDAANEASAHQMGKFLQAADARMGNMNPMKWAMLREGETETDVERDALAYDDNVSNSKRKNKNKTKGRKGSSLPTQRYDVESHDPAGPLAERGSVGSATLRYASWEGGRKDGRALIQVGKPHPIPGLMARAKQRWVALKNRQSKTFAEAVREYQRRFGTMPPKGFDQWYAFAKYHDVQLIDEFNIIEEDFRMFRAFSGESFRARVDKLSRETDHAWDVKVLDGVAYTEGEMKDHDRAKGILHLIRKFSHLLPDLQIVYNGHDTARVNVGWEERMRLDTLVSNGQYDEYNATDAEMKALIPSSAPGWGMSTICPANSAVREQGFDYGFAPMKYTGHEMPDPPEGSIGTVVDSFTKYMDVCDSPQYRHFHSSSSHVFPWHPTSTLPLFTAGVQSHFADIHCVITEQFGLESRHDPSWEEKPFDRLSWRGQTSGPYFDKGAAWRTSHRARLHILSHQEDGQRTIAITDSDNLVKKVEVPNFQLNPTFLDTGFVGPPVQCNQEDGTCDEMREAFNGFDSRFSFERASLYKYVLDVDGNSWSGRFPRLMASNAAVVKATIYREFWTDWCIPWLHFIPVQVDYSDLWDVMAFFRGGLGREGAHDDLAKEIAIAGKTWARDHFRYEDMEAYTFRQYLEYARLWADDREALTYDGEIEGYEPVWAVEANL